MREAFKEKALDVCKKLIKWKKNPGWGFEIDSDAFDNLSNDELDEFIDYIYTLVKEDVKLEREEYNSKLPAAKRSLERLSMLTNYVDKSTHVWRMSPLILRDYPEKYYVMLQNSKPGDQVTIAMVTVEGCFEITAYVASIDDEGISLIAYFGKCRARNIKEFLDEEADKLKSTFGDHLAVRRATTEFYQDSDKLKIINIYNHLTLLEASDITADAEKYPIFEAIDLNTLFKKDNIWLADMGKNNTYAMSRWDRNIVYCDERVIAPVVACFTLI